MLTLPCNFSCSFLFRSFSYSGCWNTKKVDVFILSTADDSANDYKNLLYISLFKIYIWFYHKHFYFVVQQHNFLVSNFDFYVAILRHSTNILSIHTSGFITSVRQWGLSLKHSFTLSWRNDPCSSFFWKQKQSKTVNVFQDLTVRRMPIHTKITLSIKKLNQ